jgi:actin beta/gamma 1
VFFENFEVQRVYVALQAVMSLYAVGRSTGIVVDSGDGVTHTVPVFEGFSMPHAVEKMDIAGRTINDYCQRLLMEAGHNFVSSAEQEIVKAIKESQCYVAQDYEAELAEANSSSDKDVTYTLPDKSQITVTGSIRIQTPELIFRPSLNGKQCQSVQDLTWSSIQKSDIDVRAQLLKNIIMSGGTTMYEGMSERLNKEISSKTSAEVRIIAQPDRKYAVWKGASTLASLSTFVDSMITAEEFQENGPSIVHRKCGGN